MPGEINERWMRERERESQGNPCFLLDLTMMMIIITSVSSQFVCRVWIPSVLSFWELFQVHRQWLLPPSPSVKVQLFVYLFVFFYFLTMICQKLIKRQVPVNQYKVRFSCRDEVIRLDFKIPENYLFVSFSRILFSAYTILFGLVL